MARVLSGEELAEFLEVNPEIKSFTQEAPNYQQITHAHPHYENVAQLLSTGFTTGVPKVFDNGVASWELSHGLENHPTRLNPRYGRIPNQVCEFELGGYFERMTVVDGLLNITYRDKRNLNSPCRHMHLGGEESGIIPAGMLVAFKPETTEVRYICEFDKLGFAATKDPRA